MPNYDYQCAACGTVTEVFHKMSEDPEVKCPDCESPMKRKISAGAGIMFKGSGFYVNDYKNSGCKAESKSVTKTEESTSTKTDANKTETKIETAPVVKTETSGQKKA